MQIIYAKYILSTTTECIQKFLRNMRVEKLYTWGSNTELWNIKKRKKAYANNKQKENM